MLIFTPYSLFKTLTRLIQLLLAASLYTAQAYAFDCFDTVGTCKPIQENSATLAPPRIMSSQNSRSVSNLFGGEKEDAKSEEDEEYFGSEQSCQMNKDKTLVYCSFFQCDASGKVLMSDSQESSYDFPFFFVGGDSINKGIARVLNSKGKDIVCYANCCYEEGACGKLLGELNTQPGCRNRCCPTHGGFLNKDCSDTCTDAELSDDENGTLPDFPGDGDVEVDYNSDGFTKPSTKSSSFSF